MSEITVTVSGSFHRHLKAIKEAVKLFNDRNIRVLSPADPTAVDRVGEFIFVASDRHRSIKLVQDRHLAAISQSTFLWLVSPDGYVGHSAALEVGFAIAFGIPIFSDVVPPDLTLAKYVIKAAKIDDAIDIIRLYSEISKHENDLLLVDPLNAIAAAHQKLEIIGQYLSTPSSKKDGEFIADSVTSNVEELQKLLSLTPHRK
jgi:hypothetical protein